MILRKCATLYCAAAQLWEMILRNCATVGDGDDSKKRVGGDDSGGSTSTVNVGRGQPPAGFVLDRAAVLVSLPPRARNPVATDSSVRRRPFVGACLVRSWSHWFVLGAILWAFMTKSR